MTTRMLFSLFLDFFRCRKSFWRRPTIQRVDSISNLNVDMDLNLYPLPGALPEPSNRLQLEVPQVLPQNNRASRGSNQQSSEDDDYESYYDSVKELELQINAALEDANNCVQHSSDNNDSSKNSDDTDNSDNNDDNINNIINNTIDHIIDNPESSANNSNTSSNESNTDNTTDSNDSNTDSNDNTTDSNTDSSNDMQIVTFNTIVEVLDEDDNHDDVYADFGYDDPRLAEIII